MHFDTDGSSDSSYSASEDGLEAYKAPSERLAEHNAAAKLESSESQEENRLEGGSEVLEGGAAKSDQPEEQPTPSESEQPEKVTRSEPEIVKSEPPKEEEPSKEELESASVVVADTKDGATEAEDGIKSKLLKKDSRLSQASKSEIIKQESSLSLASNNE